MLKNKQKNINSPTATSSENPVWDFLTLVSIIITTPVIFLYSLLTGKIRNPFIIVAFVLLLLTGLFYASQSNVVAKKQIKTKIIQQTLEELNEEDKEELRNTISTLRKSVDASKIPMPLHPLLDVQMDMLSINYLLFMVQSGYIQPNGQGSEFILDSYLHSKHKDLQEKSWIALQNIKSENSERVIRNYQAEVDKMAAKAKQEAIEEKELAKRKAEARRKANLKIHDSNFMDGFGSKLKNGIESLRNR